MHKIPQSACPKCGKVNDAASFPGDDTRRPKPGDLTICIGCQFGAGHELLPFDLEQLEPEQRAHVAEQQRLIRSAMQQTRKEIPPSYVQEIADVAKRIESAMRRGLRPHFALPSREVLVIVALGALRAHGLLERVALNQDARTICRELDDGVTLTMLGVALEYLQVTPARTLLDEDDVTAGGNPIRFTPGPDD